MALSFSELSNTQIFTYKGYSIHMNHSKGFWGGKRTYFVSITISEEVYKTISNRIMDLVDKSNPNLLVIARMKLSREIFEKVKSKVTFFDSFTVEIGAKFTFLDSNTPYVKEAISKIKAKIDSEYKDIDEHFKDIDKIF